MGRHSASRRDAAYSPVLDLTAAGLPTTGAPATGRSARHAAAAPARRVRTATVLRPAPLVSVAAVVALGAWGATDAVQAISPSSPLVRTAAASLNGSVLGSTAASSAQDERVSRSSRRLTGAQPDAAASTTAATPSDAATARAVSPRRLVSLPTPSKTKAKPKAKTIPGKTVPGTWVRPSVGAESSCFCMRWGVMHDGVDLAGPMGAPIVAVGDGVVVEAGPAAGFGLWVVIQHANGDLSVYGHMYNFYVTVGEHVKAGQHIADIGSNGQSTGPHLHFGVMQGKLNGPYIDPAPWLKARGISLGAYDPNA